MPMIFGGNVDIIRMELKIVHCTMHFQKYYIIK